MSLREEIDAFWQRFLFVKGLPQEVSWQDCFHFEQEEAAADHALEQVLAGVKQATFTSLNAFAKYQLRPPRKGDLSILTDGRGTPRCVIHTEEVVILPFKEVTLPQALWAGEDDTLEGWRIRQRNFLIAEGRLLGHTFSPDQSLVLERFAVVYEDDFPA